MRFSALYARFRGSTTFLWCLVLLLAGWFLAHWLTGFDHGYGLLNIVLSTEASLSVALLIMAGDKQDAMQRKQLEYMLHMMEAIRDALARQSDPVQGHGRKD